MVQAAPNESTVRGSITGSGTTLASATEIPRFTSNALPCQPSECGRWLSGTGRYGV